jgi:hypothetical protein
LEKVLHTLNLMAKIYANPPDDGDVLRMYLSALERFDSDLVVEKLTEYIKTSKNVFFPKIPELLAILDCKPSKEQAWAEVLATVRRVGVYGTPTFSHEDIGKAVKDCGWSTICQSPSDYKFTFYKIYD